MEADFSKCWRSHPDLNRGMVVLQTFVSCRNVQHMDTDSAGLTSRGDRSETALNRSWSNVWSNGLPHSPNARRSVP